MCLNLKRFLLYTFIKFFGFFFIKFFVFNFDKTAHKKGFFKFILKILSLNKSCNSGFFFVLIFRYLFKIKYFPSKIKLILN